jgi:hypothetical protein
MDLRYSSLSPTAAAMVVDQNSIYASSNSLGVLRLHLIVGLRNLGIADSLLTVSMFTLKFHFNLAKILTTHIARVES